MQNMKNFIRPTFLTGFICCCLLLWQLRAVAQIPKPVDVFGFEPGADYKLADYAQTLDFYSRLDNASDRVKMVEIGRSVQGRPLMLMFISSEKNLQQLEQWRSISEQLSKAKIEEATARQLAGIGKAIVWVDAGLHASEKACAQMIPELAYRMVTEETLEMQKIRENVVTLVMPNMNPDGLDIVTSWYRSMLGTPHETTNPPWLYHPYVGHDNNRDWFMNNMPETQAVSKQLYEQWFPQIVYNHHQTAPAWTRIFIPPFANPVNPNIHPGVTTGVNQVGVAMANRFAMNKMPGVISQVSFDMWWNGGMRTVPYFHNQIGILTETAQPSPTPQTYKKESKPKTIRGVPTDGTSIFYADPWEGGESHFRDAVDYMLVSTMAVLDLAATRKEQYLFNIYQMGKDAVQGKEGGFAYIIPAEQWDKGEAVNLVNILRMGGVEVQKASKDFTANGIKYTAGSFIVYCAQAFRPYVVDLLERQVYPDLRQYPGGPPDAPYDIAGWTLPLQMGVKVDKIPSSFSAVTEEIKGRAAVTPGQVLGKASFGFALSPNENAAVKAINILLKSGATVGIAKESFTSGKQRFGAGTYLIENTSGVRSKVLSLARELGLQFTGLQASPMIPLKQLKPGRVGIYKSWRASMDEGWTRWLLEQYAFDVDTLHDKDLVQKDLKLYQTIIIPDQEKAAILNGYKAGDMPQEYVGGMGKAGVTALKNYVEQGGSLITFDAASDFAVEQFELPLKNIVDKVPSKDFYIPGSLLKINIDKKSALTYGMPQTAAVSFNKSRAYTLDKSQTAPLGKGDMREKVKLEVEVVASYANKDLLMSGWALGEEKITGQAAVVQVKRGQGKIVLFAFPPQFRGQPRGTYKLFFNAIYDSSEIYALN